MASLPAYAILCISSRKILVPYSAHAPLPLQVYQYSLLLAFVLWQVICALISMNHFSTHDLLIFEYPFPNIIAMEYYS